MPFAIAVAVILVLLVTMWVVFAKEPGPGPADVAIAYEGAWDHLDFDLLYDLSGDELRDGLRRDRFIAAKKAAYSGAGDARLGAGDRGRRRGRDGSDRHRRDTCHHRRRQRSQPGDARAPRDGMDGRRVLDPRRMT